MSALGREQTSAIVIVVFAMGAAEVIRPFLTPHIKRFGVAVF
jgi:hypothetical protein